MRRSNASLRDEASGLARELGQELPEDFFSLKNDALVALVESLHAAKAAPASDDGDGAPDDSAEQDAEPSGSAEQDGQMPSKQPKVQGRIDQTVEGGAPEAPTGKPPVLFPLQVAPGRALNCTVRGLLRAGAEVKQTDFTAPILASLISKGAVLDNREHFGSARNSGG